MKRFNFAAKGLRLSMMVAALLSLGLVSNALADYTPVTFDFGVSNLSLPGPYATVSITGVGAGPTYNTWSVTVTGENGFVFGGDSTPANVGIFAFNLSAGAGAGTFSLLGIALIGMIPVLRRRFRCDRQLAIYQPPFA